MHDWPPVRDIIQWISIHALLAESDSPHSQKHINSRAFLSTLSLRRATEQSASYNAYLEISIHALLAESDFMLPVLFCYTIISIHALLAESDSKKSPPMCFIRHFYPRSPCGERRSPVSASTNCAAYFYPRSPCGERPPRGDLRYLDNIISIHALLAESDGIGLVFLWWGVRFLSTLSLRRATNTPIKAYNIIKDFYPRSPCGERPG